MRWVVILWCAVALPAFAADDLKKADSQFKDFEYQAALKTVGRALRSSALGPADVLEGLRIKGLSLSALGRLDQAVKVFRRVLAIDPDFKLAPNISPKLAAPFYQAVAMSQGQKPISVEHTPPASGTKLAGITLEARLVANPLGMVRSLRLRYATTRGGLEMQRAKKVSKPALVTLKLPAELKSSEVFYYFEAVDRHGAALARSGNRFNPHHLGVKASAGTAAVVAKPKSPVPGEKKPVVQPEGEKKPQGEKKPPVSTAVKASPRAMRIVHVPPSGARSLAGLSLRFFLRNDPDRKAEWLRLRFRVPGASESELLASFDKNRVATVKLPADLRARQMIYILEVTGGGRLLAMAGTEKSPFKIKAGARAVVPAGFGGSAAVALPASDATAKTSSGGPATRDKDRSPAAKEMDRLIAEAKAEQEQKDREKAERDKSARDQAAQDQAAKEKAAREKAAKEKVAKEKAAREKAAREKAAREKVAKEKVAKEKAAREKAAKEKAAREKAARQKAAGQKAAKEKKEGAAGEFEVADGQEQGAGERAPGPKVASVDQAGAIRLTHTPPERVDSLPGLALQARLEADPKGRVEWIRIRYTGPSGGKEQEVMVPVPGPGPVSLQIPKDYAGEAINYRVVATDLDGKEIAHAGAAGEPYRLRVVKASKSSTTIGAAIPEPGYVDDDPGPMSGVTPWYKTWWFWSIVGVAVVGGTVGGLAGAGVFDSSDGYQYGLRVGVGGN